MVREHLSLPLHKKKVKYKGNIESCCVSGFPYDLAAEAEEKPWTWGAARQVGPESLEPVGRKAH